MKEEIASIIAKEINKKEAEIISLIEIPPSPDLGDYAFPCFSLSKELKKNPAEIAKELAKKLKHQKEIEKIQPAGPYINFFVNKAELAKQIISEVLKQKDNYGKLKKTKQKIILEFPSPNTNKPLHVGHIRNIILGQSISKILEAAGNSTVIVNLNNDRGIHICKSMVAYEKFGKTNNPKKAKKKSDHFVGDYYVKFSQDPQLEEKAKECLLKWEAGDKKTLALWKKMNLWALNGFNETYKRFGLKFKKQYYESKMYNSGKEIILDALKKGIVSKNQEGAVYAGLSKYGLGEKILLRADGTSIYITQDIYLANLKQKDFNADSSIIITATEQNYHFQALFKVLELLGFKWADNSVHLGYGMVNLESGRMKSREGNVVDADDLLDEMESLALKEIESRYGNLSRKEKQKRAKAISQAAIRYFFLKVDKIRDIVFKPEESIKFEGDTGPYILYTYARAKSILRKAKSKPSNNPKEINEQEKQLILQLSKFPEIVLQARNQLAPNLIAHYVYQLSQSFNEYYHANPVIGSDNEEFRLALVCSLALVLKNALSLLSIDVLEEM